MMKNGMPRASSVSDFTEKDRYDKDVAADNTSPFM